MSHNNYRRVVMRREVGLDLLPFELQTIIYRYLSSVPDHLSAYPLFSIQALLPLTLTSRTTSSIVTTLIFKIASSHHSTVSLALNHSIRTASIPLFTRYRPFLDTLDPWSHRFTETFFNATPPSIPLEVADGHCLYARSELVTAARKVMREMWPFNLEMILALIAVPTLDDHDGEISSDREIDDLRELFRNCFSFRGIGKADLEVILDAIVAKTGCTVDDVLTRLTKGGQSNRCWDYETSANQMGSVMGRITVCSTAAVELLLERKTNMNALLMNAVKNEDRRISVEIVGLIVGKIGTGRVSKSISEAALVKGESGVLRILLKQPKAIEEAVVVTAANGPPETLNEVLDIATTASEGAPYLYTPEFANRLWGEVVASQGAGKPFRSAERGYDKRANAQTLFSYGLPIPTEIVAPLQGGDPANPWLIAEFVERGYPVSEGLVNVCLRTNDGVVNRAFNDFGPESVRVVKRWTGLPEARHVLAAAHHAQVHGMLAVEIDGVESALDVMLEQLRARRSEQDVVWVLMDVLMRFESYRIQVDPYPFEYVGCLLVGRIWTMLRTTAMKGKMGEETKRKFEVWWARHGWTLVDHVNLKLAEEGWGSVDATIW